MLRRSLSFGVHGYDLCLTQQQLTSRLLLCCRLSTAAKPLTDSNELAGAKPFSAIPGPKGLPLVGSIYELPLLLMKDNAISNLKETFEKYGPIYKVKIGKFAMVSVCDADAVERLHRQEGKYPARIIIDAWRQWRDEQGLSRGILTEDGPDWKRMRTMLDKQMLRPKHVATYADNFNGVVTDLIKRLKFIRDTKGNGVTVPNIDHELFHWSLETIGTVLYETRFGGLSEDRDPEIAKFIEGVQNIFVSTSRVVYLPVAINRIFLRKWQKLHEHSWDIVFRTTQKLIDKKFTEIQEKLAKGEETSGFLAYLLSTNMTRDEVYGNISDIMLGAVDTTSNTMQWVLYEISKRPDLQEKLYSEVTSVVPVGRHPTYEDFQEMPLLKAIVKECLRLYPVAGVTSRIPDSDIVLCGYHIPAGTTVLGSTFMMGRDPKFFNDPLSFRPERWLRSDSNEAIHSFAWLPFGFGPRSCIGRRVAELEMHLLLARISQTFFLKPGDDKPLKPTMRGLIVPEYPVNVQFIDRKL